MILSITGTSGFVGTNLKNENLGYQIQDIDLLQTKPGEIEFNSAEVFFVRTCSFVRPNEMRRS